MDSETISLRLSDVLTNAFDVSDASRAKVVIKPRCKEYAKKRREVKSLSSLMKAASTGSSQDEVEPASVVASTTPSKVQTPTKPRHRTIDGRVEKRTPSPKKRASPSRTENRTIAEQFPLPTPPEPFVCGNCSEPSTCTYCRLLRLIDKVCFIHDEFMAKRQRRKAEMLHAGNSLSKQATTPGAERA
ncbi:hypothetical protein HGRIS_002912 [Hohenbuehelia grisea]|uniref:Uncharacterized protein n=1 Tax=Hohenbuehelia grisea TaxID=104357 RepID=A0ABR3JLW1_9AGAR